MVFCPGWTGNESAAAPLALILVAYRALLLVTRVHVNQYAGVASKMTHQQ